VISDACLGLVESVADFYQQARWQRCVLHWYRNALSHVLSTKMRKVAFMLKAIHAQESRAAVQAKAREVATKLKAMTASKRIVGRVTAPPGGGRASRNRGTPIRPGRGGA
jgi:transposase-like protein